ncbi:hypothetical protein COU89_00235, partial [Candidatus Roizmanbacteria bacterium CG10_big_fil_rev_8_21_14_0_10_45_7]
MENNIIVGNLKAFLNHEELSHWITTFVRHAPSYNLHNKTVIVCPPDSHLQLFYDTLIPANLGDTVSIGAQDVSALTEGAHTGEIMAQTLSQWARYALIGHHERRVEGDTPQSIQEKITQALAASLKPIVCLEQMERYEGKIWAYAYEPAAAIGTGAAQSPQEAQMALVAIKQGDPDGLCLYGGSVDVNNIHAYMEVGFNGVLIGKKSI